MNLVAYQDSFWGFCVQDARNPPQGVQYPLPFERLYERLQAKGMEEGEKKNHSGAEFDGELERKSMAADKPSFLSRTTMLPLRIVHPKREDPLLTAWSGGSLSTSTSRHHAAHSLGPSPLSSPPHTTSGVGGHLSFASSPTAWCATPLSTQGSALLHEQWKRQDLCTTLEFPLFASPREAEEEDPIASVPSIVSPLAVLASLSPTFPASHTSEGAKKKVGTSREETPAFFMARPNEVGEVHSQSRKKTLSHHTSLDDTVEVPPHGSRADKALPPHQTQKNKPTKYWTIRRQALPAATPHPSDRIHRSRAAPPPASRGTARSPSAPATSPTLSLIRWQVSIPSPTFSSFCSPLDYFHLYIAADVLGRQQAMQYARGQIHNLMWLRGPLPGVPIEGALGRSKSLPHRHSDGARRRGTEGRRRGGPQQADTADPSHAYPLEEDEPERFPSETRMQRGRSPTARERGPPAMTTTAFSSATPPSTLLPTTVPQRTPPAVLSRLPSRSSSLSSSPSLASPSLSFSRHAEPSSVAFERALSPSIPPLSTIFAASLCAVPSAESYQEPRGKPSPWREGPHTRRPLPPPPPPLSCPTASSASSPSIASFRTDLSPSALRASRAPSPCRPSSASTAFSHLSRSPSPFLPASTTASAVSHCRSDTREEHRHSHSPPQHHPKRKTIPTPSLPLSSEALLSVTSVRTGMAMPSPSPSATSHHGTTEEQEEVPAHDVDPSTGDIAPHTATAASPPPPPPVVIPFAVLHRPAPHPSGPKPRTMPVGSHTPSAVSTPRESTSVDPAGWEGPSFPSGNPPPSRLAALPFSEERTEQHHWWNRFLPFRTHSAEKERSVSDEGMATPPAGRKETATKEEEEEEVPPLRAGGAAARRAASPSLSSCGAPCASLDGLDRAGRLSHLPDRLHPSGRPTPRGDSVASEGGSGEGDRHSPRCPLASTFRPTVMHASDHWHAAATGDTMEIHGEDEEEEEEERSMNATTVPSATPPHARLGTHPSSAECLDGRDEYAEGSPADTSVERRWRAEAVSRFSGSSLAPIGRSPSSLVWTHGRGSATEEMVWGQRPWGREGGCSRDAMEAGSASWMARLSSLSRSASSLLGWKVVKHHPTVVGEKEAGRASGEGSPPLLPTTMEKERRLDAGGGPPIPWTSGMLGGSPTSFTTVCRFREEVPHTPSRDGGRPSSFCPLRSPTHHTESGTHAWGRFPCRASSAMSDAVPREGCDASPSHHTPVHRVLPVSCPSSMGLLMPHTPWGVLERTHDEGETDKEQMLRCSLEEVGGGRTSGGGGAREEMVTPVLQRPRLSYTMLGGMAPRRKRMQSASSRRSSVKKVVTRQPHPARSTSFSSTRYQDTGSVHTGRDTREELSLFSVQRAESTPGRESLYRPSGDPRSSYTRFSLPPFKSFLVCRHSHGSGQSRSRPSYPPVGTVLRLSSGRLSSSLNVVAPTRGPMLRGGGAAARSRVSAASSLSSSTARIDIAMHGATRDGEENGRGSRTPTHIVEHDTISAVPLPSVVTPHAISVGMQDREEELSLSPSHPIPTGLGEDGSPTPMCRPSILLSRFSPA